MIKNLDNIVREKMFALAGTVHSYEHVERVFRIATYLAFKERADIELVQIGALLHDIGRVLGDPHNETGAKAADEILTDINYAPAEREKIRKIILYHPLSFRHMLTTKEEKVLWDADKIDLLGIIGIAKVIHWLGRKPFTSTIEDCRELLLPIYDLLNTPTAKSIAKARYERMTISLSNLAKELSLGDLPLNER
jgi:uncharacterized protein